MRNQEDNRCYQRKWYARNKKLHMSRVAAGKRAMADRFQEYKTTQSCETCGENRPATLVFHHRDPTEKDDLISKMAWRGCGWRKILDEIAKCDVLCANCHRMLHDSMLRGR